MINLLTKIPNYVHVACSGGCDSMAALDFLRRKQFVVATFFHHDTPSSESAFKFLYNYCNQEDIPFQYHRIETKKPSDKSQEEHWRDERYKYFDKINGPVVTAHHLDDAIETWVWSSMHGQPKLPEIYRGNVTRPFLITPKKEFQNWCIKNNVPWYDDPTNLDTKYMRNYIRHTVMPVVQHINPGIQKTIKKKLISKLDSL